jgi:hypothetical protein
MVLAVAVSMSVASFALAGENRYKTYVNARFGYSIDYPDIFDSQKEPDNGDGIEFSGRGGEVTLTIWGGHNVLGQDGAALLNECKERVAYIVEDSEKCGTVTEEVSYYWIEYGDGGGKDGVEHIFSEAGLVNADIKAGFIFKYPKDDEESMTGVIAELRGSLALPQSKNEPGESGEAPDISLFTIRNKSVYRDGVKLEDATVNEVPAETEGSIRFWSAFGADRDGVKESETGVGFFSREGDCLTFVPLESEFEAQDVVMSPGGGAFVLVTGSGFRPDMFFNVYGEGTEKMAEFSGMRGQLVWLDPVRFVFIRIDGTRDLSGGIAAGHWLKTSLVMYDTAAKEETVLKEATDKLNYSFLLLSGDGSALSVTQESVKSEKDWEDDDKVNSRDIEVEISAAG